MLNERHLKTSLQQKYSFSAITIQCHYMIAFEMNTAVDPFDVSFAHYNVSNIIFKLIQC